MMRAIHALLTLSIALTNVASGLAQDCAEANDYTLHEALGDDADLKELEKVDGSSSWAEVSHKLDALREAAIAEGTTTQLPAYRELAAVLQQILDAFGGTASTANELRLALLKPQTCPTDEAAAAVPCAWEVLSARVSVPIANSAPWTCANKRRFAKYLRSGRRLLAVIVQPALANAAKDLRSFERQWRRYIEQGYSQYPWEVLFNGWAFLDRSSWAPPANQLIALHPAVGFGTANLTRLDDRPRTAAFVLAVEAVGYVRYLVDFRHHLGLSAAMALPNLTWDDIGAGAVVHFDGFGVGYSVGLKGEHSQAVYLLLDVTRNMDDAKLTKLSAGWMRDRLNR